MLFHIIRYYHAIIAIISVICIIALCRVGDVSIVRAFSEKKMPVWATHLGYHVGEESQRRSYHLVRSMTWTCGSWDLHTVFQPTSCVCDECLWHAANQIRSYSGRI